MWYVVSLRKLEKFFFLYIHIYHVSVLLKYGYILTNDFSSCICDYCNYIIYFLNYLTFFFRSHSTLDTVALCISCCTQCVESRDLDTARSRILIKITWRSGDLILSALWTDAPWHGPLKEKYFGSPSTCPLLLTFNRFPCFISRYGERAKTKRARTRTVCARLYLNRNSHEPPLRAIV